MRSLGIKTYREWSRLSRRDRTYWIAFEWLERDVEAYALHADILTEKGFTLADWCMADEDTRNMKIKPTGQL